MNKNKMAREVAVALTKKNSRAISMLIEDRCNVDRFRQPELENLFDKLILKACHESAQGALDKAIPDGSVVVSKQSLQERCELSYRAGYVDRQKGRDYDPLGNDVVCNQAMLQAAKGDV